MKPICTAVIVAAGKGRRMGTEVSKQFLPLCGKEILAHSVEKFEKADAAYPGTGAAGGMGVPTVKPWNMETIREKMKDMIYYLY